MIISGGDGRDCLIPIAPHWRNGPLSLRKIQTSPNGSFSSTDAPNPAINDCEHFVHTATPTGIKNTPYGVFFIPGGVLINDGIRYPIYRDLQGIFDINPAIFMRNVRAQIKNCIKQQGKTQ